MMLNRCSTSVAIVLLGVMDERGIMRFPVDAPETPGLMFQPETLKPINEQIFDRIEREVLSRDPGLIDICQEYSCEVTLSDSRQATLYLATMKFQEKNAANQWDTMPELLRAMPKSRNRLAYLKAWQVLTGAMSENIKVIEQEEMARHIANDAKRKEDQN